MDPKPCDKSVKNSSDFMSEKKILHSVDKSIACPTPEKKTEPLLATNLKDSNTQLPEKYKNIGDLFSDMSCALRLLHLRKKSPTFQNICNKVEVLAKRNFSYAHLAQMKYILPKGIEIEKVVVVDKKSLCMKPDLKITLVFDVVEDHSEQSADLALIRYFNSKLINFFNLHPEVTDIPEAALPEPFSQRPYNLIFKDGTVNLSKELSSTSNEIELSLNNLHLSPSFKRHFSQKNVANETELVQSFSSSENSMSSHESDWLDNQESESTWQKECTPLSDCVSNNVERGKQKESQSMCIQQNVINTPVHKIYHPHSVSRIESPDLKIVSCTDSLLTHTPAQSAPERLLLGSDVKLQKMTAQKSGSCFKPAKRVLDFTLTEGSDAFDSRVDMSKPSRGCSEDFKSFDSVSPPQEVDENLSHSFQKINVDQHCLVASDNNPSSLVELVNVIDSIFDSVKRTSMTKEELLQKIMMNCLDFVKIREAEEQIEILEKTVPDWLCKKVVSSGDTMYCVKNALDLDSVRSRLLSNVNKGDE
ncbi:putative winged helix-turn-helix DNA-binding domain, CDT1 Geminin-binding domain-containing protein [Medicago truncatula]|uniref:DNA replication factor CDT1-like protein n=1 Tax=Medicago truncatula TaxID=3880 RepID=A0A072UAU7_MEDTR|nr:CDT1-like protein a, chloroplastic [Medicago truncatula]XP_024641683.1 CDT1-like protein a, chloroplastic [Medicago truncatula]XP_039682516.1 CDT1-like protein a, chloroplastic [Medicago truncatula]KEH26899.1 DNA replication factor CDT1-like protein [Medicago truncatula]RHN52620.1 putative winged helix-turn-helix DNA-binding domain, CDT1 Geminin-binding domain-containing protein [Medicago truncatula]